MRRPSSPPFERTKSGDGVQTALEEDLSLDSIATSIGSISILPANTVRAMLASLPIGSHPLAQMGQSREQKAAVMRTLVTRHRIESGRLVVAVLAYTVFLTSVAGAIALDDWQVMWLALGAIVVYGIGSAARHVRRRGWQRSVTLPEAQKQELAKYLFA